MDRPKRKTKLPAKLLESEQIVNKKKVHKLAKNPLKDITVPSSQSEHNDTNSWKIFSVIT